MMLFKLKILVNPFDEVSATRATRSCQRVRRGRVDSIGREVKQVSDFWMKQLQVAYASSRRTSDPWRQAGEKAGEKW